MDDQFVEPEAFILNGNAAEEVSKGDPYRSHRINLSYDLFSGH